MCVRANDKPVNRGCGSQVVAPRYVGVHERRPQRPGGDAGRIDLAQCMRENTDGAVGFAALEKRDGKWSRRLDIAVEPEQKLFGFLEATLAHRSSARRTRAPGRSELWPSPQIRTASLNAASASPHRPAAVSKPP